VLEDIVDDLVEARREIADLHRRMANVMLPARVTQTDPAKGLVKVTYANDEDGNPVESPWIRWGHRNGPKIKEWCPPGVGEQVLMYSPGGEISTMSWAMLGGFHQNMPKNHDKDHELKWTVGDKVMIHVKEDQIHFKVGNSYVVMTEGKIETRSDHILDLAGRIDHNEG
jgi:phage baseplate assembly protein gpV